MSEELNDKDPFAEEEEADENLISEAMVKKATWLIHKLAERRGAVYKDIQKKCKKLLGYENLAKVTMEDGHRIIDKLVELTGGEEEPHGARVTDDLSLQQPTKPDAGGISAAEVAAIQAKEKERKNEKKIVVQDESEKIEELEAELGKLAEMLQICVGFSRDIVKEEIGKDNITEGTQAMMVKSFTATLFIEASKRGLGR